MKFNKNNLVDFNNEYRTIYFNHAELLGVDGVVSNVPILKGTLPPYCKTFYIKPHSEDKDLLTVLKKGDRSYRTEPEDIKMFITYQKIDISGNQVDIRSSEFHIYKNIMYRYELEDWIKEMREYRRQYLISKSREIKKKKKAEEEEKERLRGVLNKGSIVVNNICIDVLFANRIIIGDFYKDGYKYYICSSKNDNPLPDMLTNKCDMDLTMFGTLLSPVPIFMEKESVELQYININFNAEVSVDNAEYWIREKISEYDDHELLILEKIEEVITGILAKLNNFNHDNDTYEEYLKKNSYEIAEAIKESFGGKGMIGKIGDYYVWTNIVTGRSYDYKGRREGHVEYNLIDE